MLGVWDVRDVGYWGCGMLGMWYFRDVGCSGCRMLGMSDVRDVEYWGCGMFRMWGCGMLGIWYVRDVGCSGCRMWVVEFLQGCRMLIYKMPDFLNVDTLDRLLLQTIARTL